ncbi:hypothetical protein MMC21_003160 [Puttea exsequens]|nr:hypothetical protein [Puttea exsequens]
MPRVDRLILTPLMVPSAPPRIKNTHAVRVNPHTLFPHIFPLPATSPFQTPDTLSLAASSPTLVDDSSAFQLLGSLGLQAADHSPHNNRHAQQQELVPSTRRRHSPRDRGLRVARAISSTVTTANSMHVTSATIPAHRTAT